MLKKEGKFLFLLLCAALSFCVLSASAFAEAEPDTGAELMEVRSGTCGDNLTWTLDTSTGQLTISGTGAMADDSWSSLNYIPWYDYRTQIRSVVVQNGVTSIGKNAFYECENLTNVTISESVTDIGSSAFYSCTSLTEATIPASVTNIENNPFNYCSNLKSITVEEGNTVYCSENGILYRFGNNHIIDSAYSDDEFLYTSLEALVCYPAGKEESVIIGVSEIGNAAFAGSSLSTITVPDSVTTIGSTAFAKCSQLSRITLPHNVTSLGTGAFINCTALREISIQGSIPAIGNLTFVSCSLLETVYLPESITSVGSNAFTGCNALKTVYYAGSETEWNAVSIGGANAPLKNASIICNSICGLCGDNLRWSLDSATGTLSITGSGAMDDYDDYIQISPWYDYLDQVTFVEVGAGITHIGDFAFAKSAAVSVCIPASVTRIGSQAFFKCNSLSEITVNANSTAYKTENGALLTYDGKTLVCYPNGRNETSYTIADGVTTITEYAFYGSENLKTVFVSDTVETIRYCAFKNCSAMESIQLPKILAEIGWAAFSGCNKLETVYYQGSAAEWIAITIAENNETLVEADIHFAEESDECSGMCGENVWWELNMETGVLTISGSGKMSYIAVPWHSLRSSIKSVVIQDGVTSIGDAAFDKCECLLEVSIADSVSEIGIKAFRGCFLLKTVTIPEGVTTIPERAFSGCTSLKTVTLPNSLTCVDKEAFYECAELTAINLGSTVETIGECAFYYCFALENITIPGSVTSMGESVFSMCGSLTSAGPIGSHSSIEFGWTEEIPDNAFSDCGSLTSITIPGSISRIGSSVFSGCSRLTEITIPIGVTAIGDYTFYNCSSLKDITIPSGVTDIGKWAFCGCSDLTSVIIPDSVTIIDGEAFYQCSALKAVILPDNLEKIGEYAFARCDLLEQIKIPDSVTDLGDHAFEYCDSLKMVVIGNGLTDTGKYTFWECGSLETVILGSGLEKIGYAAFDGCTALTSIEFPDSLTQIDDWAFANAISILSVRFPSNTIQVQSTSFDWWTNLADIFFEGTEDEWNEFNETAGLRKANLFSSEDYNEELKVKITTEEVSGGVKVSMATSGNGMIYYTLDGTTPCTASIPYAGSFLLDEAGDIFINAIVVDRTSGTYGDVVTEYVDLGQSIVPEIFERNGAVYICADMTNAGGIYYTYDLTTEPTTTSPKYDNPIVLSETKVIRARVIETGKAPSELMSYAFYVSSGVINYPHDSYSFTNTEDSFGYSSVYRIGEGRYGEIFGSAAGKFLYDIYKSKWGGSCFGMSATSLMFSRGVLSLSDYSSSAQTVNALTAPRSRDSELTKLIERYQVAQFLPEMVKERNDISSGGNMVISGISPEATGDALLHAVEKACTGEEPIVMILWKNGLNGSHAVVPYKLQNGQIYLYDCNRPNEENILSYTKNADGTYAFSYGEYSYAVSYNTLSTLLARLEGLQTGQVSLTADGKEQILISLNTKNFRILDAKGNEVTDYMTVRATEDMTQSAETVLYLDVGNYTILNLDNSLNNFTLSAATETDFNTVTVEDLSASIQVGVKYGHLSIAVTGENETAMTFHTCNASGQENEIELTADYAKIYASTDLATLVETTVSSITGNGGEIELTQNELNPEIYFGSVGQLIPTSAREAYDGSMEVRLNTDITELVEDTFTLTANITGAGETAVVYAASYDTAGKMTAIYSWETQAGKTKYPFTIEAGTAAVKIYVLDKATSKPLTEPVILNQGE